MARVYNKPPRYLGHAFLGELEDQGGWDAVAEGKSFSFSRGYMSQGLSRLRQDVMALQRMRADGRPPVELLRYVLDQMGYRKWLCEEDDSTEPDDQRADNLDALLMAAARWTDVEQFLNFALACASSAGTEKDAKGRVQISTVHKAKGLEWPIVAVAGITKDKLPHRRGDAEEERRILYVAITRARDRLLLSCYDVPSPFWFEVGGTLPASLSERADAEAWALEYGDEAYDA